MPITLQTAYQQRSIAAAAAVAAPGTRINIPLQ